MREKAYRNYLLALLTITVLFCYVDRLALGIALQDIKVEFDLTDSQLGFLGGFAFALFYSIMGIPIARWADRGNRALIIALTTVLWSVTVPLFGVAGGFVQLIFIRVIVAVGEAGCAPTSYSLMADYFSRAELPRATAVYGLAAALCAVPGYLGAGWLNELYGWRVTFIVLGIPGMILAALAWFTLREPRFNHLTPSQLELRALFSRPDSVTDVASQPDLKDVAATLWFTVTFRHLLVCYCLLSFTMLGNGVWNVPFFVRAHGLTTGTIGAWLTLVCGLGALGGAYIGGIWVTRHAAGNERLQLRITAVGIAAGGLSAILLYIVPSSFVAFMFMGLTSIGVTIIHGPLSAAMQTLVPVRMRAVALALTYLAINLIGLGLGPLAVGAMSDMLRSRLGEESLRYALVIMTPGYFWAAWYAWRAANTVQRDLTALYGTSQKRSTDGQEGADEIASSSRQGPTSAVRAEARS